MKKYRKAVCILLSICLVMCGCRNTEKINVDIIQENEKIQIGMSFDSFVIERWQRDRDVFVSMAKELGAEVNIQNANGDVEEQIRQIEYFIKKKVDAIVIICIDSDALKDTVKKAKDAGIIVVSYDRLIENADTDIYISFENEKVGSMMAQSLVDVGLSGGKVVMLGGSTADYNVSIVEDAFQNVCEKNNIQILDSYHADGWLAELAGEYVREHMEIISQADAIMCGNDDLASQVVPVLAENRLAGKIYVTGQDADLQACQRIVEGTQLMTVYKPVERLAQKAAECTVALVKGEELPVSQVGWINDGTYDIKYVGLEPFCVTENNIDTIIIESGFHLKEDVYLNVPSKMPK